MKFYSFWRSTASYRVRITLHYKNISFEEISVDLPNRKHKEKPFSTINPHQRVPTIDDSGFTLSQSMAIMTYLEDKYPNPSIFPTDLQEKAIALNIAELIISDIHPLNNSGSIRYLKELTSPSERTISKWYTHWIKDGFTAIESLLNRYSNRSFCIGNSPSIADICLIPQIYNAKAINVDLSPYPILQSIDKHCMSLKCFTLSRPENQKDYTQSDTIPGS